MRFAILALVVACSSTAPPSSTERIDLAMQTGAAFLATRQHTDGSWRSRTYSALRDGWSVTPLVVLALRMSPQQGAVPQAYARGVDFVASIVSDRPRRDPEVSYPHHAYALSALVLGAPDNKPRFGRQHAALLAAIRARQLVAFNGWDETDVSFGGWGYASVSSKTADAVEVPTANLSATVLAVGALALGGAPDDPALVAARHFIERCQNADGGMVFSLAELGGNKAGSDEKGPRSYGSMTADGLRALVRLGRPLDDPKVTAAIGFLSTTFDATKNPGAFPAGDEVRRASSYYYWAWTAAHVARHLNKRAWAEALVEELLARQKLDGSWRNEATEMREDDPLVATPFALAALGLARSIIAAEPRSHAY